MLNPFNPFWIYKIQTNHFKWSFTACHQVQLHIHRSSLVLILGPEITRLPRFTYKSFYFYISKMTLFTHF